MQTEGAEGLQPLRSVPEYALHFVDESAVQMSLVWSFALASPRRKLR